VQVKLSVRSGGAQLSVSQDAVAFPGGTESSKSLLFRNSGTAPLTITSMRIVALTDPPTDASGNPISEFSVVEDELPSPFQIEANGTQEVRIQYSPIDDIADEAQLVIASNSTLGTKQVYLTSGTLTSEIVVQPTPIIFGASSTDEPSTQEFSINNAGLKLLSIQGITLSPPDQGFTLLDSAGEEIDVSDPNTPRPIVDIAGGGGKRFSIRYTPTGGNDTDGVMTIKTNADNVQESGGLVSIPLLLSGAEVADLEIDKLSLDFSDVGAGESGTESVVLTNQGGQPLEITRIALSDATDTDALVTDEQFQIVSGAGTATLAAGETRTVEIQFSRGADDRYRRVGALIVESNAQNGRDIVYMFSNPDL